MRKVTRKGLIRKLDKAVSQLVIKRDGKCFTCGSTQNLQCGHLFTRSLYIVRWDLLNCHAQCNGCNFRHEHDPTIYNMRFIDKYGLDVYRKLYRKAHRTNKFTDLQLKQLLKELN